MHNGHRIISVEAADIYKNEQKYSVAFGNKSPEKKSDAYFWLFKNKLDYSLDSIEFERHTLEFVVKSSRLQTNIEMAANGLDVERI